MMTNTEQIDVKWFNATKNTLQRLGAGNHWSGICCAALVARIYDEVKIGGDRQHHIHRTEKEG
jgi:hypothetical protein